MIDYSIAMLSNPTDESAPKKAYAKIQCKEVISFAELVRHISDHNGVFSRGTVEGVMTDTCDCVVESLLNGCKVQLGALGSFWLSLSSKGADSAEEFTANNIHTVNIIFTPGEDFENLVSRAKFNLVSSRAAQAATLKAEKEGKGTVDLAAAKARK